MIDIFRGVRERFVRLSSSAHTDLQQRLRQPEGSVTSEKSISKNKWRLFKRVSAAVLSILLAACNPAEREAKTDELRLQADKLAAEAVDKLPNQASVELADSEHQEFRVRLNNLNVGVGYAETGIVRNKVRIVTDWPSIVTEQLPSNILDKSAPPTNDSDVLHEPHSTAGMSALVTLEDGNGEKKGDIDYLSGMERQVQNSWYEEKLYPSDGFGSNPHLINLETGEEFWVQRDRFKELFSGVDAREIDLSVIGVSDTAIFLLGEHAKKDADGYTSLSSDNRGDGSFHIIRVPFQESKKDLDYDNKTSLPLSAGEGYYRRFMTSKGGDILISFSPFTDSWNTKNVFKVTESGLTPIFKEGATMLEYMESQKLLAWTYKNGEVVGVYHDHELSDPQGFIRTREDGVEQRIPYELTIDTAGLTQVSEYFFVDNANGAFNLRAYREGNNFVLWSAYHSPNSPEVIYNAYDLPVDGVIGDNSNMTIVYNESEGSVDVLYAVRYGEPDPSGFDSETIVIQRIALEKFTQLANQ